MLLSDEQRVAVDAGPIDLFISAGAGSGKTRVLTARFVHAVLGYPPYPQTSPRSILTVTFTERAAGELAERIRGSLVAEGATDESRRVEEAWISTIHGMCSRILRQHAFEAGLDPRFVVATEVEAGMLAHQALETAIQDAIDAGDADINRLVDTLSFADIATAVGRVYADVRSMGRSTTEVARLSSEAVDDRIDQVEAAIGRITDRMTATCRTGLKTVSDNIERLSACTCDASLRAADRAVTTHAVPPGGFARLKRLAGDEIHNTLVDEADALFDELERLVAQLLVAPHEEALLRLLVRFDEYYASCKAQRSLLDFEDLQVAVAELFDAHPKIAEEYRRRFAMVMIDEFQDTNALQLSIARHLSDDDMCTVGDDKQSIYSFRHADVEVFRARQRSVDTVARLADNYRSHPELLAFFNGVFGHEALFGDDLMALQAGGRRVDDDGWPKERSRARVVFIGTEDGPSGPDAEAIAIADEFAELRAEGVDQGDMVLLLRKMSGVAEVFERELRARGFDVFIASGGTYFDTPEAGELIALLRLVDNTFDDEAAVVVLAGRFTGTTDDGLFRLRQAAGKSGSLWSAARAADGLSLSEADSSVIARTVAAVERMRDARGTQPLGDLLLQTCERLDYDLALFAGGVNGARAWANVLKLARIAEEFEESAHGDIGSFLDYLSLRQEHVASEQQATVAGERAHAIRIMSIHAAKGLEFPVVAVASISGSTPAPARVLVGPVDGTLTIGARLPLPEGSKSRSAETTAHHLLASRSSSVAAEEIKRLLYVACTRAERGLVVCVRDDLSKPTKGPNPPALIRSALGFQEQGPASDMTVELTNHAVVEVRLRQLAAVEASELVPPVEGACDQPPRLEDVGDPLRPASHPPDTISYSGLATYRTCPYRFYIERIVGMPARPRHASGGGLDPREFGNAVHEAFRGILDTVGGAEWSLDRIARAHGLQGDGRERLERAAVAFGASALISEVRSSDRFVAECPINSALGACVLVGSIDLIAWTGDEALVVDYKTGDSELSADDARERYGLQARCYGLAALRAGASRVRVVFFEPERAGRVIEYAYMSDDAGAIEAALRVTLDAMARGEYATRDAYESWACDECAAFGSLCPITRRGAD